MSAADRIRYATEAIAVAACDAWESRIHSIRHVVVNPEGDYSFMGHINCEWCDMCEETESGKAKHYETRHCISGPHAFRDDPYAGQHAGEAVRP